QHLAVGPGQVEDAVGEVTVAVFTDQRQALVATVGDTRDQVDGRLLAGLQRDAAAYGDHGVEHGSRRVRQGFARSIQRLGRDQVAS
nr:hypothetical protein [Tanacetum cinerariifolium]